MRRAARHVPHFYAVGQPDSFAASYYQATVRRLKELGFELRTANPAGVGHALPSSITELLLKFMEEVRGRKR